MVNHLPYEIMFITHMYTRYRPADRYRHKIHPHQFQAYHEVHAFRYLCCLCATNGKYVEASIFPCATGIYQGEYVAECATTSCGYMRKWVYLHNKDIGTYFAISESREIRWEDLCTFSVLSSEAFLKTRTSAYAIGWASGLLLV